MSDERPILFQPVMVVAILRSAKTVTRRTGPKWASVAPGTRLWVREAHALVVGEDLPDGRPNVVYRLRDRSGVDRLGAPREVARWRSPIHMPRWACRLELEVVSIRALPPRPVPELLEGEQSMGPADEAAWRVEVDDAEARSEGFTDAVAFGAAWLGMHGEDHPWPVYRVEFRRIP